MAKIYCYKFVIRVFLIILISIVSISTYAQTTTYWIGARNTDWFDPDNWNGGVPTINTHVVIGDRVFSNNRQPAITVGNQNQNNQAKCLSLTIGGVQASTLTIESNVGLHIETNLNLLSNGTLRNIATPLFIKGDWINDGTYLEEPKVQNNNWMYIHKVEFIGTNQRIAGSKETQFLELHVKGYLTLESNLRIELTGYNYGNLIVYNGAVIDPASKKITWGNASGVFNLMNGATAKVKATNYLDNYSIRPTPAYGATTISHTNTIDYAGTIDQNIDNLITYQKLVISGSGVKSLTGNTTVSAGATDTQVNVNSATLDLKTNTLDRAAAGGSFTVASGAKVKIGGQYNTPGNFATRTFDANSTVEYYGADQTVQHNTYGHLTLSNTGIKKMPSTAMTVQGNLVSSGSVQYTAESALAVGGKLDIGVGTAFTSGAYTHTVGGNWINNGTFTHSGGDIRFIGNTNTSITGETVFNVLTINKTAAANTVTLNNNTTATTLNMTNGELHTGANKVVILGDRTGNGWVLGTVNRLHSFIPDRAYAFNGPYATMAFSGGAGVTEASMITGTTSLPTGFISGKSVNRLYEVIVTPGTYTNAVLQLQYQDTELNGCEEDGLKLYRAPTASGVWRTASRHAYDATQNWVRRNSLSDVSGFWTLTDNPSTYRWDGNVSIAWEDGANWEVITDGDVTRGITGPISSDFVELGGNFPARQPTISLNEWVKDIKFYAANQMTLSVTTGSLRTNGNLGTSGGGTGTQHLLTAGAQALNIGGSLILNDGNTGNNLALESTTGTITVTGGIQQHESGSITLGSGTLNIGGDYTYTAGNFTAGASTVNYNGAGAQVVGAVPYHHLSISKPAGTATYTSVAGQSISGNLSVNNAGTLDLVVPSINVAGSVSVTGGVVRGNAATIDLKGDWNTANTSSYVPGTSTVTFSGSAPQTVSATTFYNLAKTTTNTLTTTGSSTLNGSLDVQSGTLILNEHTMNRSSAGGALALADNAAIQVNGAAVFPTNFSTNTLGVNSTVTYSGGAAAIEPVTYGKLNLQNSSTRALNGNTRVANLLTIDANSILNNSAAAYTLTLDNDLTNNGNINAANTSLSFTSPAAKLNGTGAGNTIVKDVVVAAAADLAVSKDITLHGNLVNNGTGFSAVTSQVEFTGAGPATITSATPVAVHKLLVSKTGAATAVTLAADITGLQSINVVSGTLDAANKTLTEEAVAGTTLTVANAATIKVGAANSLPQFDNYSLAPTSTVVYNGSSQVVKSVQYGHLDLQNFGTATFEAGIAKIAGNMTKSAEANVITPQTIEFNGAVDQAVAGVSYNTLKISAPGNKTLTGNAAIADKLWLTAGMLLTNLHEITLSETATLEGEQETSFVSGTIKTTRAVPANIKTTFGGIGIAITPAVEAGLSAMTRVTGTAVGENANSIKRYYRFQAAQNADKLNADIEAAYLAADLNGHSEPDLQLYSARYLGDGWTAISEVDNTRTTKTITASGVNNINFLTFSTAIKPLPVELVYFKAAKHGTDTRLEWKTAMEEDNSGFEVEVSADGYSYQKIGFVKSAVGTSATPQIYIYTDTRNGKDGILYYRLRQLDMDGTDKFYGPCSVNFGTVTKTTVTAYPNPFISEVKLAVEAIAGGKATLTLYTSAGRVLMQHEEQVEKGTSVLQLNLYENLPRGLYLLTVEQNGKAETLKLIKN